MGLMAIPTDMQYSLNSLLKDKTPCLQCLGDHMKVLGNIIALKATTLERFVISKTIPPNRQLGWLIHATQMGLNKISRYALPLNSL